MVSEPDTRQCANEEVESQRGWTRDGVPARTLRPKGGWIEGSHIDWRRKRVPARTLGPKGGWIVRSHIGWEEYKTFFIRVWKPLTSRRVLKTSRGSLKGKAQRWQYLLEVGLGCYKRKLGPEKSWTEESITTTIQPERNQLNNASFPSPTNVGSHNSPPLGPSVLAGTQLGVWLWYHL